MNDTTEKLLLYLGLGVLAYYLLTKINTLAQTATAPVANAIADAWLSYTLPAPMQVLGNVQFPDGSLIPLASLSVKGNPSTGNVGVLYGGHLFNLQPSDADGNWPAILVQ